MDAGVAVFVWLSIGSIALFTFLAVAVWTGTRAAERETYYKNDLIKKIAESPEPGGSNALEYLREQHRFAEQKRRGGLQLGGLITTAVGIGLMVFLGAIVHPLPVYLAGLIPVLIGIALLIYARFLMPVPPAPQEKSSASNF